MLPCVWELANYDNAKFLLLEKLRAEQAQENQLLKQRMAELAKDKEALEKRNKSLQEKNKSITKNHKGKIPYPVFLLLK